MQSSVRSRCAVSTLALGVLLFVAAGCNRSNAPLGDDTYGAPEPSHPAMKDAASAAGSSATVNPHGAEAGALPPGHPPVPSQTAGGVTPPSAPTASGSEAGDVDGKLRDLGIGLKIPGGWREVPSTSSMRLATYRLERAEGDPQDAEVSLMALPSSQTEDANIVRWRGQFQDNPEAATATREKDGIRITTAEIQGTFTGSGKAEPETRMWGAIIRVQGGGQLLFLKSWGPRATMEKWKASFEELVTSVGSAE